MKNIVGTLLLLLRWISIAKCELIFVDRNDGVWPPKRLLVMTDDHDLLEESGLASEQPAGFACTQKEHIKSVLGGAVPKCGCPDGKRGCYMRCRKITMLVQVKNALGGELGALDSLEKFQGNHVNKPKGCNVAETFHFSYKQKVMATFDSNLRLHGIFKVNYLTHTEFRLFDHGKEIGPHAMFLAKSASFKHNKKEILIMKSNQWLDTKDDSEETCQPLVLRINGEKDWTLHRLESSLMVSSSLSALFKVATNMPKYSEEAAIDFEVPEHLREDMRTAEQVEKVIIGLHSVHCVNGRYKPLKSFVAYQQLLDSSVEKAELTFWPKDEFDSDPTCGEHAILAVPPVAALTLNNIVCFPGSGSKWLLEMIQFLSGYITDVKGIWLHKTHHDNNIYLRNALSTGEPRPTTTLESRFTVLDWVSGRCILLFRDPYSAITSWWNHMRSGISTGKHSLSKEHLEESLKSEQFCEFASGEAKMWRNLALDHLTLCTDKLVVFYEDLKRDYEKEMMKILRFLKIPRDEEKLGCLRKHPMSRHRRSQNSTAHPSEFFCPKSKAIVESALEEVRAAMREHMFTELPEEYFKH